MDARGLAASWQLERHPEGGRFRESSRRSKAVALPVFEFADFETRGD